jgi:hypothetical protein
MRVVNGTLEAGEIQGIPRFVFKCSYHFNLIETQISTGGKDQEYFSNVLFG